MTRVSADFGQKRWVIPYESYVLQPDFLYSFCSSFSGWVTSKCYVEKCLKDFRFWKSSSGLFKIIHDHSRSFHHPNSWIYNRDVEPVKTRSTMTSYSFNDIRTKFWHFHQIIIFITNHIFFIKNDIFNIFWKSSSFFCRERPWERHRYGIEGWLTVINRGKPW